VAVTVTLTTLKTKLGALMKDPNESSYSASEKTTALNLSIDAVADFFNQWGGKALMGATTINLVADTETYAISREITTIEKVTVTRTDGTLRPLSPIEFVEAEDYDATSVTGSDFSPSVFYRNAYTLGFKPVPKAAAVVTVYHTSMSDELSGGSDQLAMPPWVRNMILFKAAVYLARMNGDRSTAVAWEQEYEQARMDKQVVLENRSWQSAEPDHVKGEPWEIWSEHLLVTG
jgi:hypothetical protein